jgi:hypothetical protein
MSLIYTRPHPRFCWTTQLLICYSYWCNSIVIRTDSRLAPHFSPLILCSTSSQSSNQPTAIPRSANKSANSLPVTPSFHHRLFALCALYFTLAEISPVFATYEKHPGYTHPVEFLNHYRTSHTPHPRYFSCLRNVSRLRRLSVGMIGTQRLRARLTYAASSLWE